MTNASMPQEPFNSGPHRGESLARGLGIFCFVTSLLVIFFAGTFPFDFNIPASPGMILHLIRERFDWRWLQYDPGFVDRAENILFFMPFGFSLAAVILTRPAKAGRPVRPLQRVVAFATSFFASALLSSLIEMSQSFVSFRDPSLMDVWANAVGGCVGALVYIAIGEPLFNFAAKFLIMLRPLAKPQWLAIILLLYSGLHLAAPLIIQNPGNLSSWDRTMPLTVGNELTGDRAWRGSVSDIVLADRAATSAEAAKLSRGDSPENIFNQSLLAHYQLRGSGPYLDLSNHLGRLEWVGTHEPLTDDQIPQVSSDQWLKTREPVSAATNRIGETSQFTIAATASTLDLNQGGPARLVSISLNTGVWDIQLGQELNDWVIRVRTGSRRTPDLYVRNAFTDTKPHHLLVTHKLTQLAVYLDGEGVGNVEITPEAKVIWRLYPRGFRMYIDRYGYRSYAVIYRMLVFIPFATLLGATLIVSRLSLATKRFIAITATLLMAIALELILAHESASGFQPRNLAISLIVGLGTIGILAWRRRTLRRVGRTPNFN